MEKPILFNTEMVKAILDGRKTMTRRVIKPQPEEYLEWVGWINSSTCRKNEGCACWGNYPAMTKSHYVRPKYQVGDVLWVRETWTNGRVSVGEESDGRDSEPFISQCVNENDIIYREDAIRNGIDISETTWRPSIHMPRTAARLFLRVKNVRVERLQDINSFDAMDEGIRGWTKDGNLYKFGHIEPGEDGHTPWKNMPHSPKEAFEKLWNSTIKKQDIDKNGWEVNPWVWVIEFERVEGA